MASKLHFLRSLLFAAILCPFTIIWATICICTFFLPYKIRYLIASCWNKSVIWLAKVICGIQYQIIGLENLPDGPTVFLSKHQSAWETIYLFYAMQRPIVFVMKKELLRIPFFGWALGLIHMIAIDRAHGTRAFRKVIEQGKKRIAEGLGIVIFPEGTRTAVGEKVKYHNSGTRLAMETKSKVVPIALNSGECWPRNSFIKKPGKITISIGEPISVENKTADSAMKEVETWIESEMHRISPHVYKNT